MYNGPLVKTTLEEIIVNTLVEHDGVIFKGEREVIKYEGLTATTDHLVWVEGKQYPVKFGVAASCGAHLVKTGHGYRALNINRKYMENSVRVRLN